MPCDKQCIDSIARQQQQWPRCSIPEQLDIATACNTGQRVVTVRAYTAASARTYTKVETLAWHVVEVRAHSSGCNGLIIPLLLKGQPKQDVVAHCSVVDER